MWYPALTKAKRPSPHIQASDSSIVDQLTESAKATETYVPELQAGSGSVQGIHARQVCAAALAVPP